MGEKKLGKIREATTQMVQKLSPVDQEKLHEWATKSLVIVQRNDLTKIEKTKQLSKLNPPKHLLPLIRAIFEIIKDKAWKNQSWARRGLVVGLTAGTAVFGSAGAGVASAGFGIAVPVALLTTMGVTFLGVLIDEVNKERKGK